MQEMNDLIAQGNNFQLYLPKSESLSQINRVNDRRDVCPDFSYVQLSVKHIH